LVYRDSVVFNFDPDRFHQGIRSTVFKKAPAGFYYPTDPGFPGKSGTYKQWLYVAPRVGFAWDPKGDGRTSIRAGFGLSHDLPASERGIGVPQAAPWGQQVNINSPIGGFENPWLGVPGGNIFPVGTPTADATFSSYP